MSVRVKWIVRELCQLAEVEENDVARIEITPTDVRVWVYRRDAEGKFFLHYGPDGVAVPVLDLKKMHWRP